MADEARINQFRKMAQDDPDNELGHFSLGKALLDGGHAQESLESFRRTLELNPNLSKAYALLGDAFMQLDRRDDAVKTYKAGAVIANERGDLMVKNDLIAKLKDLGEKLELAEKAPAKVDVSEGEVLDRRTGSVGRRLPAPPFSNWQGKLIYENVSQESWKEWIGMGTKVINELRLPLSDPRAQEVFDKHMYEFLNVQDLVDSYKPKK
ncbi:MAG: Fe(2+)-trafficking protein [Phycisphaerae bacterium]